MESRQSAPAGSSRSGSSPSLVPAVTRALGLLERLAQQREPMSLARLATELALPKSSVHGICNTLLSLGYLHRQDDGTFRIGAGVMPLAEAFMAGTGVTQEFEALWRAAPPEETIVLSVLNGTDVVYVAARHGQRPLGLAFSVGMRLPAWIAATGQAMLAFDPEANVRKLFGHTRLSSHDGQRSMRLADFERELEKVRKRGYSIDDEGVRAGVYCIGAPVFDVSGRPVAGIGVCVSKATLGADGGARHRDLVLASAHTLSQRLGGEHAARNPSARRGTRD